MSITLHFYLTPIVAFMYSWVLDLGKEDVSPTFFGDEVDSMALILYLRKNTRSVDGVYKHIVTLIFLFGPSHLWAILQIRGLQWFWA